MDKSFKHCRCNFKHKYAVEQITIRAYDLDNKPRNGTSNSDAYKVKAFCNTNW